HYESILFTKNKFPGVSGMLYETLPDSDRLTTFDMQGELRLVLDTYVAASKRYALNTDGSKDEMDIAKDKDKEELEVLVLATARANCEGQAKAVGWMKKTWLAVWEKQIVEKLVRDFEKWIKRLRQLMTHLGSDYDAEEVGLLEDVPLRKLIVAPPNTQTLNVTSLQLSPSAFLPIIAGSNYGTILGSTKVIIEHKTYDINGINIIHEVAANRINQLIAPLHYVNDIRFKVLRCINHFDETPLRRIGMIFELPPGLDGPPTTLFSALSSRASFGSFRPSLNARMRLARALAETVLRLHSINWRHKSIRSETALLLSEATTTSSPPRGPLNLEQPRLSGFKYSRLDNDFTSAKPDFDLQRNIYRHPERWDYPKDSFPKIHDIYSLGVVLLEVGLWEPIINFDGKKGGESLKEHYPNARATKDRLV
ncbi:MAG: hypothetical protein LQ337_006689, partial [Flavoplaca oasis]